jgi:hypothetical protein
VSSSRCAPVTWRSRPGSPRSRAPGRSVNTAVAARVGPDRLGFYLDAGGNITVHRDGRPFAPASGETVLGGGALVRERDPALGADSYTLRWADSSTAWLDPIGPWGVRLATTLAQPRRGQAAGLLGDANGDAANEPLGRDGRPLRRDATGRPLDPASRSAALAACRAAGVTDPARLDACVLDVGLTGLPAFAVSAVDVDRALRAGPDAGISGQFVLRDGTVVGPDQPGPGAGRLGQDGRQEFALDVGDAAGVWLNKLNKSCNVEISLIGANGALAGEPLRSCALPPDASAGVPADGSRPVPARGGHRSTGHLRVRGAGPHGPIPGRHRDR